MCVQIGPSNPKMADGERAASHRCGRADREHDGDAPPPLMRGDQRAIGRQNSSAERVFNSAHKAAAPASFGKEPASSR